MLLIRQHRIYRADIQANRDILYVFGDNLDREGFGGQAKEMRGEVNSFGVATKRSISHNYPQDYFFDDQLDTLDIIKDEFDRLEEELSKTNEHKIGSVIIDKYYTKKYKAVILPLDGLGTGLARLRENAPKALAYIEDRIEKLKEI